MAIYRNLKRGAQLNGHCQVAEDEVIKPVTVSAIDVQKEAETKSANEAADDEVR